MSGSGDNDGISAEDLAIIAAAIIVIGDIIGLLSVLAAKNESEMEAKVSSRKKERKPQKKT
ncbi:hypothetical protein [Paenibacillus sp. L3-i20]|uniref:hypothetical protein n=1 Tax=Paenibacillus sp. L3-i20 TaxID=2905833 RepID=UPI001EDDD1C1|nr:hypothetical protein [Paenibacillus sp. L3-i20]GKU78434.1 hypothetical protein L3i20_v228310 [Paenibacillus sp. L3-i20]